jgi:hypothetical protein
MNEAVRIGPSGSGRDGETLDFAICVPESGTPPLRNALSSCPRRCGTTPSQDYPRFTVHYSVALPQILFYDI